MTFDNDFLVTPNQIIRRKQDIHISILVTARSSGILKAKQKLGVTLTSDKLGGIDFTKFSELSMCWPMLAGTMAWASS